MVAELKDFRITRPILVIFGALISALVWAVFILTVVAAF